MARHHADDFRLAAADPKTAIAEALSLLNRIADSLEELIELERTEPLDDIIYPSQLHPSVRREQFDCDRCGGTGGLQGPDNTDIDECPDCEGTGHK